MSNEPKEIVCEIPARCMNCNYTYSPKFAKDQEEELIKSVSCPRCNKRQLKIDYEVDN